MYHRPNYSENVVKRVARNHGKRAALSVLTAVPLVVFGAWLMRYEVHQGFDPKQAYVVNWPLNTLLAFLMNYWFLWSDRGAGFWKALQRWILVSLAHSCISFSSFVLLVTIFGWQYLAVSLSLTAVLGTGSYILRHAWIFVAERRQAAETA